MLSTRGLTVGRLLAFAALLGSTVTTTSAQQGLRPTVGQPIRGVPIESGRILDTPIQDQAGSFMGLRNAVRGLTIYGIVQNHLGVLVPNAGTIYVRNIMTGNVVAETQVNELAQFILRGVEPGLYTAELVAESGAVIASSTAFTASVGEVIQIAQTIPTVPLQGLGRLASSATTSAMTSAASTGVLAVAEGPPASPGQ